MAEVLLGIVGVAVGEAPAVVDEQAIEGAMAATHSSVRRYRASV
jgi:hypothetical protein